MSSAPTDNAHAHSMGDIKRKQPKPAHPIHPQPKQATGNISQKNWPFLRYPVRKIKTLLAIAATLVTLIWLLRNTAIPFRQWKMEATPTCIKPPSPTVLEVFQVYPPLLATDSIPQEPNDHAFHRTTQSVERCTVVLMEHSFGFSYGKPFVGNYTPPACKFNKVTMNFTVTSKGRQFDRLAIMYFNNTEIWRTSTAEPTFNGIHWEYHKDMSAYMFLWSFPQKIIFDLGNLVNDVYTGSFNTTLTATFSMVEEVASPANLIIPISAYKGSENSGSVFILPTHRAGVVYNLPRNINRAVVSLSACGQGEEEFWWANVLHSDVDTFKDEIGTLYGFSPFREVQLLIDGQIAGVQWPFPVIFTGGVVPGLWRPIVGIDAFDLRTREIDVTPWLPLLCDGKRHSFEIRVVGIKDDGNGNANETQSVGNSWYVSGNIFLWLDEDGESITTGNLPQVITPPNRMLVSSTITENKDGTAETLTYTTNVTGGMSIYTVVTSQKGSFFSTWAQTLSVINIGRFTNGGRTQETTHKTTGLEIVFGANNSYRSEYVYPLYANTTFAVEESSGNFSLEATLEQGLDVNTRGSLLLASLNQTTNLSTTLNGSAYYFGSPQAKMSTGYGSTNQTFSFKQTEAEEETYHRDVSAINGTVVKDIESLNGTEKVSSCGTVSMLTAAEGAESEGEESLLNIRQRIGRGPGDVKQILIGGGGLSV